MELYKKYRPQSLDEMIGNEAVISSLKKMISANNLPHTILFSGSSGCGKTTLARILAKELGCKDNDVTELNMSHKELRGIDGANEITSSLGFKSLSGNNRVLILDEVDQMTSDAQKLMKKPLEDSPSHVWFFLCTTKPEKVIRDIITRSTQLEVEQIDKRKLASYIRQIAEKEEKQLSTSISLKLAEKAEGSVRKAMVFLEQVLEVDENQQDMLVNRLVTEVNAEVIELCRALMNRASWSVIAGILKGLKEEPESVRYAILGYFNSVLLNNGNPRAASIIISFSEPFYNTGKAGLTCACFEALN
jgi:DNA polymerase-3 subunit gamma/tau